MKKFALLVFIFFLGMFANAKVRLDKIDFKYNGQQVIISYNILGAGQHDKFYISAKIFNAGGKQIEATIFSGDIGSNVSGGMGKTIVWNTKADNVSISESICVQLTAIEKTNVNAGLHLTKSIIFPGLGDYRLDNKKSHFVKGLAAYGALTGAVLLNLNAYNTYQSYLTSSNTTEAITLFDKAQSQQMYSSVLIGTTAAIWTYSLINTAIKVKKLKSYNTIPSSKSTYYANYKNPEIVSRSDYKYTEIKGEFKAPNLQVLLENEIEISNKLLQNVNALDAEQSYTIKFKIANIGSGTGIGLLLKVRELNKLLGLQLPEYMKIGNINSKDTITIEIPIETEIQLESGKAHFQIDMLEQNDFSPEPITLTIPTRAFIPPNIQVADFLFTNEKGGIIKKNDKFFLQANIQNMGQGVAQNVKIEFQAIQPNLVLNLSEQNVFEIPLLEPGKGITFTQEFLVKPIYKDSIVKIDIKINENFGRYTKNKTSPVTVNLLQEQKKQVHITSIENIASEIKPMLLNSDVDINIPTNSEFNPYKFAVIIGNEDYKSRQPNLQIESNVAYAINDAIVFRNYLQKTLGFPAENIKTLSNATYGEMKSEIMRLMLIFSKLPDPSKGEIIFYYAGHGYPDQSTQAPYLIPVDISANDLGSAIKMSDLYEQLAQTKAGRILVFLDACFSGGGRDEGLVAARGVRIKPQSQPLSGNMVVFSASSGNQTALPFKEQKHGYFTYYLLKKIQETKGNVSLGELEKYIKEKVSLETTKAVRPQDPEVNVSTSISNTWQNWPLR